jgi:hypothetical protein
VVNQVRRLIHMDIAFVDGERVEAEEVLQRLVVEGRLSKRIREVKINWRDTRWERAGELD